MNPRQRRGVLALLVAGALAVLCLTALQRYTEDVAREVGDRHDVLVLVRDVAAYQPLTDDDVQVRSVPRRWTAPQVLGSPRDLRGRVATTPLARGTYLERGDLTRPPSAGPAEREVAVVADVAASVAGSVRPEDRVDVIAVVAARGGREPAARVVAGGIRVLRVDPVDGRDRVDPSDESSNAAPGDDPTSTDAPAREDDGAVASLAVTVAVTPAQATALVLAYASAEALRLALVPRGSAQAAPGGAA